MTKVINTSLKEGVIGTALRKVINTSPRESTKAMGDIATSLNTRGLSSMIIMQITIVEVTARRVLPKSIMAVCLQARQKDG
ncbi:MAG: hypothetical protein KBE27_00065 [Syntrophorhabdaceae bacterium]|nr:hypothetical protein [Syntrophorhabdaceae bacterium]